MKLSLIFCFTASALLASTGCNQEVAATVNCKVGEGGAVNCTIAQTKGTAEIEVCWDFKVTCESGATLETSKACGTVKDGQTTSTTIPADNITVTGTCDKVKNAEVTNMSWSAK